MATITVNETSFPNAHFARLSEDQVRRIHWASLEILDRLGCDWTALSVEQDPGIDLWELGYGDVHLVPDLTTLRRAGWTDRAAIVLCDVHDNTSHGLVPVAPAFRRALRRQTDAILMGLDFLRHADTHIPHFSSKVYQSEVGTDRTPFYKNWTIL